MFPPLNIFYGYHTHIACDMEHCFQFSCFVIHAASKLYGFEIMSQQSMATTKYLRVLIHESMQPRVRVYPQKEPCSLTVLPVIHSFLIGAVTP